MKKQRSISCTDEEWQAVQARAGQKAMSASEYLLLLSEADSKADDDDILASGDERRSLVLTSAQQEKMTKMIFALYVLAEVDARLSGKGEDFEKAVEKARQLFDELKDD